MITNQPVPVIVKCKPHRAQRHPETEQIALGIKIPLQKVISQRGFNTQNISQTCKLNSSLTTLQLPLLQGMVPEKAPDSPVDAAFEDLYEVIPELKMLQTAQIVPGANRVPSPDAFKSRAAGLRDMRTYASEPNLLLKMKKTETTGTGPCTFAYNMPGNFQISPDVSEWLRYSMQLADQSQSRGDPFFGRDAYREQIRLELEHERSENSRWYTTMAATHIKTEQDADELLIQKTQNACSQTQVKSESHEFRPPQECSYRATPPIHHPHQVFNDTHVVPEPESFESIFDLEKGQYSSTPPALIRNSGFSDQLYSDSYLGEYEEKKSIDSEKENCSEPDDLMADIDTFSPASSEDFTWTNSLKRSNATPPNDLKPFTQRSEIAKEPRKGKTTFKSGRPRLCQFLIELLNNPEKYNYMIEWLDKERGIFKFLNSGEVARMWGTRRNKPHMKYENFARSLRTYIAKGILTKPRSKLVYRFASKKH